MIDLSAKPFYLSKEDIVWVEQTLNSMTLEDKIGHLFCPIGLSAEQGDLDALLSNYKPAGIMFRPGVAEEVAGVHRYLQAHSKVPMLIAANLESGGNGAVLEGTEFGSQMQVAATGDVAMAGTLGEVVGKEGKAAGCNWAFAPVIDIDYNPHNPITNTRTYGSNPEMVAEMGRAYVKAVQKQGMATSIKHFPGDGVDYRDQHLVLSVNTMRQGEWDETFGKVYQASIDAGALTVMAGHIALPYYSKWLNPALKDHEIMPASLAPELLKGLLREQLGFNGMIVSDATSMVGFTSVMPREKAVPLCIEAGCDLFLFNKDLDEDFGYMQKGIESGLLSMERVDEAILRTLATKAALKLHLRNLDDEIDTGLIGTESNKAAAQACADKAVTLVKDNTGLLPLSPQKHSRVLLIGLGDEGDMFGHKTGTVEKVQHQLEAEGFTVTLYDTSKFTMRDMMQPVEDFVQDHDVVVYAAQFKTASNKTTLRINRARPMGVDAPWFSSEIPTVFISFGNPYHLVDVPRVPTYVNAYTATDATIKATVGKLVGRSLFTGISPVDAFVGQWDTRL